MNRDLRIILEHDVFDEKFYWSIIAFPFTEDGPPLTEEEYATAIRLLEKAQIWARNQRRKLKDENKSEISNLIENTINNLNDEGGS